MILVYVYFPTVKQPIQYQFDKLVDAKSFAKNTIELGFKAKVKEKND